MDINKKGSLEDPKGLDRIMSKDRETWKFPKEMINADMIKKAFEEQLKIDKDEQDGTEDLR